MQTFHAFQVGYKALHLRLQALHLQVYHSTTQSFSKYLEEKIKKLLYVLYHIGAVNKIVKLV